MSFLGEEMFEENEFVERNHDLVWEFLRLYGLDERDYYDVVIFSFLDAVRDYLSKEELRKKYLFKTVAFRRMKFAYYNHLRYLMRPVRYPAPLSLDLIGEVKPLMENRPSSSPLEYIVVQDYIRNIVPYITKREMEVVIYRFHGFQTHEIAERCGISINGVHSRLCRLRRRIELKSKAV